MSYHKHILVSFVLILLIFVSIAAMKPAQTLPPRNLKVLPQNISEDSLYIIMDNFEDALGVKCGFCHVVNKDKEDYASDSVAHKEVARDMLRMTIYLNKTYFASPKTGSITEAITCYTCHKGKEIPENYKAAKKN